MKHKNLFTGCLLLLFVFIFGSSNEPDNTAISSDGVKIVFDKKGFGEPAIIFVHGWANNKSIWDSQVEHFSEKYSVIAVVLPGLENRAKTEMIGRLNLSGMI